MWITRNKIALSFNTCVDVVADVLALLALPIDEASVDFLHDFPAITVLVLDVFDDIQNHLFAEPHRKERSPRCSVKTLKGTLQLSVWLGTLTLQASATQFDRTLETCGLLDRIAVLGPSAMTTLIATSKLTAVELVESREYRL